MNIEDIPAWQLQQQQQQQQQQANASQAALVNNLNIFTSSFSLSSSSSSTINSTNSTSSNDSSSSTSSQTADVKSDIKVDPDVKSEPEVKNESEIKSEIKQEVKPTTPTTPTTTTTTTMETVVKTEIKTEVHQPNTQQLPVVDSKENLSSIPTPTPTPTTTTTTPSTSQTNMYENSEYSVPTQQNDVNTVNNSSTTSTTLTTSTTTTSTATPAKQDDTYDEDCTLNEANFLAKLKKSAKMLYRRLQSLAVLCDLVKTNFADLSNDMWPEVANMGSGQDPTWWGLQEDKDLLIGVHKHGFGKYDKIFADPNLTFTKPKKFTVTEGSSGEGTTEAANITSTATTTTTTTIERNLNEKDIPGAKWLTLRFKLVIKALGLGKSGKSKKSDKSKFKSEWSKREMSDFYRAIITHGVPWSIEHNDYDFESLRKRAKLKQKSTQAIQQHYTDFLSMCSEIMEQKKEGKTEETKKEKDGFVLSFVQAKRALERLNMFNTIRKQILSLQDTELTQRFQIVKVSTITKRSGLPEWWIPIVHDKELLKGVDKHGFGKWESIFTDPESEFYKITGPKIAQAAANESKTTSKDATSKDGSESTKKDEENKESSGGTTDTSSLVTIKLDTMETDDTNDKGKDVDKQDDEDENDDNEGEDDDEMEGDDKSKKKKSSSLSSSSKDVSSGKPGAKPKGKRGGNRRDTKYSSLLSIPKDKVLLKRINVLIKAVVESSASKDRMIDSRDAGDADSPTVGSKRKANVLGESGGPSSKRHKKIDVRRDEAGNIIFPLDVGVLSIAALGIVSDKKNYHNEKYIWPIGFKSTREYTSTIDVTKRCTYTCEILDGGDKPIFKITPSDDVANAVSANSSSSAWKQIIDRINSKRNDDSKRTSVSGPEYFGFGLPQIIELISQLPGAEKCTRFGTNTKSKKNKDIDDSSSSLTPSLSSSGGLATTTTINLNGDGKSFLSTLNFGKGSIGINELRTSGLSPQTQQALFAKQFQQSQYLAQAQNYQKPLIWQTNPQMNSTSTQFVGQMPSQQQTLRSLSLARSNMPMLQQQIPQTYTKKIGDQITSVYPFMTQQTRSAPPPTTPISTSTPINNQPMSSTMSPSTPQSQPIGVPTLKPIGSQTMMQLKQVQGHGVPTANIPRQILPGSGGIVGGLGGSGGLVVSGGAVAPTSISSSGGPTIPPSTQQITTPISILDSSSLASSIGRGYPNPQISPSSYKLYSSFPPPSVSQSNPSTPMMFVPQQHGSVSAYPTFNTTHPNPNLVVFHQAQLQTQSLNLPQPIHQSTEDKPSS
eukprot:TRINITY_DN1811_c0_g3_i2.p1 TRINITY_DN1811_c0_g3~~TRINITY_DN1811_c0_g3_i2.p1  ORF type:complete len:1367 (+),score=527.34 TRINITY_DN1811_c0_g3_i2:253-4101(+)